MSDISGGGLNNRMNVQPQQVQQKQVQHQQQQQQVQQHQAEQNIQQVMPQQVAPKEEFAPQFKYSSKPAYLSKEPFKSDVAPGLNGRFGFGDIIYTMAQAGKPSGACGGSFMAVA
jgi:hypothetical protein